MATKFFKNRFQIREYGVASDVERDGLRLQRNLDGSKMIVPLGDTGATAKVARWYPHRKDSDGEALATPISEMVFGKVTDAQYDILTGVVRKATGKALKVAKGMVAVLVAVNVVKLPGYGRIVGVVKDDGYRMNIWAWFVVPAEEVAAYKDIQGVDLTEVGTRVKIFESKDSAKYVGAVETSEMKWAAGKPKAKAAKGKPVSQTAKPMAKKAKTETVGVSL